MIVSRTYTTELLSYDPTYESGIEWRSVGGIWKALDRGSITSRWSSIIVMRGTADNIANIRASIFSWKKQGEGTIFSFANHEPVFGPELSYSSEFTCLCEEADEPFVVDVGENEFVSTWTVALYPIGDLTQRYIGTPTYVPIPSDSTYIQSVTRLGNIDYKLHEMESSRKGSGFEFDTPTVEVSFISTRDICADVLCYLQQLRGQTLTITTASKLWLFVKGSLTEDVKILSISYNGPLDKASIDHSYFIMFGRA